MHYLAQPFLEKVVAFVIHHNEGRKVFNVDLPHSLHAYVEVKTWLDSESIIEDPNLQTR